MKWVLALVFAAVATPAALAQRALDCDLVGELVAASPEGFADYRSSEPLKGTNVFPTTLRIGIYACAIVLNANDTGLICQSAGVPESLAAFGYQADLRKIESCLPGWAKGPSIPVDDSRIKEVEGLRFMKLLDGGEVSVGVIHANEAAAHPLGHRVGFGVVWRRLPLGV